MNALGWQRGSAQSEAVERGCAVRGDVTLRAGLGRRDTLARRDRVSPHCWLLRWLPPWSTAGARAADRSSAVRAQGRGTTTAEPGKGCWQLLSSRRAVRGEQGEVSALRVALELRPRAPISRGGWAAAEQGRSQGTDGWVRAELCAEQ